MSMGPAEARRLKQAGLDFGLPAAVAARALVSHGLDNLADPRVSQVLSDAAEAERRRRSRAASVGGQRGGGSNRKTK